MGLVCAARALRWEIYLIRKYCATETVRLVTAACGRESDRFETLGYPDGTHTQGGGAHTLKLTWREAMGTSGTGPGY